MNPGRFRYRSRWRQADQVRYNEQVAGCRRRRTPSGVNWAFYLYHWRSRYRRDYLMFLLRWS